MSYWFHMGFKEIKADCLLDYCVHVTDIMKENAEEILDRNVYYIPSVRLNFFDNIDKKEYRNNWRNHDRSWLYNLFSVHFVYWPEKELLGMIGEIPNVLEHSLTVIDFQDSTDQDYPFEEWMGIDCLKTFVHCFETADEETLAMFFNKEGNRYDTKEFSRDIDYWRRTAVYESIYQSLELNEWYCGKKGHFKCFSFQAINNSEEYYELSKKLEISRKRFLDVPTH